MSFETIEYSVADGVATVTMNRPEALNALSQGLVRDLGVAIAKADEDGVRAVILAANGRAFCSGGDLREMRTMFEQTGRIEAFLEEPLGMLHGVVTAIRDSKMPVIAAVGGVCAGAGTNIALACDMIVAGESATFNEAFVKIGLSPDCGGTFFLPRAIGEKRAAEMLMLGGTVPAAKALEWGMVNRVVADDQVMANAVELAARLSKGPTASFARIKKMLAASSSNDLRAQLELEHRYQLESGKGSDFKEGVTAFFEKRPANFKGE